MRDFVFLTFFALLFDVFTMCLGFCNPSRNLLSMSYFYMAPLQTVYACTFSLKLGIGNHTALYFCESWKRVTFPRNFFKLKNTNEQNFRLHVLQYNIEHCSFGRYRVNSIIWERYIGAKSLKLYLEISTLETNKLTNSKAKKDKEKRRRNKILDYFISTGNAHA